MFVGQRSGWFQERILIAIALMMAVASTARAANPPTSQVGKWLPKENWPVIAIHAALLPTGNVLHYTFPLAGPGLGPARVRVWNPSTKVFTGVYVAHDIFCSGMCYLPDGRMLLTGGNGTLCEFSGLYDLYLLDPFIPKIKRIQDMAVARWYPTNIELADGSVMIFTGLNEFCGMITDVERYTPDSLGGNGVITLVPEAAHPLELYTRMHLLSNGKIAHVGPETTTSVFDPVDSSWTFIDTMNDGPRLEGSSVLIPGEVDKVMVIGGFNDDDFATKTCEIIDFSDATPRWTFAASMRWRRGHPKPVILPDKTILVIGGGREGKYGKPVYIPELYNPATNKWIELPAESVARTYHSTALLLPNGRVLSAGTDNADSGRWAQQYKPPYFFRGDKPVISTWPTSINYGHNFIVTSAQAPAIRSICLIALSSTTHSVDFSQRYVGLTFAHQSATQLRINAPAAPELAPPGYYMLFILNGNSVPATARIIKLEPAVTDAQASHPQGMAADLDHNGAVNANDLEFIMHDVGNDDDSSSDLTGDGIVDGRDIDEILSAWTSSNN